MKLLVALVLLLLLAACAPEPEWHLAGAKNIDSRDPDFIWCGYNGEGCRKNATMTEKLRYEAVGDP